VLRRIKTLLIREPSLVDEKEKEHLENTLQNYHSLQTVYQLRFKLQNIWARSTASQNELVDALCEWCKQAEATGIEVLKQFVSQLKTYVPA